MKTAVRFTCPRCRVTHVRMVSDVKVKAIREVCLECLRTPTALDPRVPRIEEHW